jgi:hypothetical protein
LRESDEEEKEMTFVFYMNTRCPIVAEDRPSLEKALKSLYPHQELRWIEPWALQLKEVDRDGLVSWFFIGRIKELTPEPRY